MRRNFVRSLFAVSVALLALTAACSNNYDTTGPNDDIVLRDGIVSGSGTVRYYAFEGGFFAIRGSDDVTYDPLGGVPKAFEKDGLRVKFTAKVRPDLMSVHMAGPIVELIEIKQR